MRCNLCGEDKPESEFNRNGRGVLTSPCKDCHRESDRYYQKEKYWNTKYEKLAKVQEELHGKQTGI